MKNAGGADKEVVNYYLPTEKYYMVCWYSSRLQNDTVESATHTSTISKTYTGRYYEELIKVIGVQQEKED